MRNKMTTGLALVLMALLTLQPVFGQKEYKAKWSELDKYPQAKWLHDMKFGMYWHWSLGSVPGEQGWYGRNMYNEKGAIYRSHVKNWGDPNEFGYKDFVSKFKAENFDAKQWVDDAYNCGARFIVGMGVHHDGFAMYDDPYTKWNSVDMNPHRDVMRELETEAKKRNMKFGVSSHLAFHWEFFSLYMYPNKFDAKSAPEFYHMHDPKGEPSKKWVKEWYKRTLHLIDNYDLDFLWFDFGTKEEPFFDYTEKVTAHFYNSGVKKGKEVALAAKLGFFNDKSLVYDIEHGKFAYTRDLMWMADCTFNFKWFNVRKPENPYSTTARYWVHQLVDIVSKNGTLLLNHGPNADGSWVPEWRAELLKMGQWLDVNGEAIYNTRPWHRFGEGPSYGGDSFAHLLDDNMTAEDIRFTRKGNDLYAIVCGWHVRPLLIESLGSLDIPGIKIKKVEMLGTKRKIQWSARPSGLSITFPERPENDDELAYVFKITGDNMFPERKEYEAIDIALPEVIKGVKEVRVVLPGKNKQLSLAELYTVGRRDRHKPHNIAMYSQPTASSLCAGSAALSNLFDNDVNGNPIRKGIISTKKSDSPWINLNFDRPENLESVHLFAKMGERKMLEAGVELILLDKNGKELLRSKINEINADTHEQDFEVL